MKANNFSSLNIRHFIVLVLLMLSNESSYSQNLYFPPVSQTAFWDTTSPASLGWCLNEIDTLYDFLQQENTKGFILLKDGRIVLEKYFGTFTQDSLWYWASAGKTITAFLVGKAQEENFLDIHDTTSAYLGNGWTSCTQQQEHMITIRHQLTMTTGLDDGVPDNHCTIDSCLIYLTDAGTRWAYHNAPYTLLEQVLVNATGMPINNYTIAKLSTSTGITGLWYTVDFDNVFFSKPRSMARFGLLFQNNCIWNSDTLLFDTNYIHDMLNTSQSFNESYGYLWWLNGKPSFMVPGSQIVIPGSYAPHAPPDMVSGLGKNGQFVCVSKSTGLVMVRMGDAPVGEVPFTLCDQIWEKLDAVMCSGANINDEANTQLIDVYPDPADNIIYIDYPLNIDLQVKIYNAVGSRVMNVAGVNRIDISQLTPGIYYLSCFSGERNICVKKVVVY
jgi:CubicO group peptidase (beta-lactamase class C family)